MPGSSHLIMDDTNTTTHDDSSSTPEKPAENIEKQASAPELDNHKGAAPRPPNPAASEARKHRIRRIRRGHLSLNPVSPAETNTPETYQGNSMIWCHGKALTGPDWMNSIGTLIGMVIPMGIHYGICIAWLCVYWSPYGYIILAFAIPSSAVVASSLFFAVTDDPGIIPRNSEPPRIIRENPGIPRVFHTQMNGKPILIKYCETCKHWRPPRALHCFVCNNCVEQFDHHCPYLSNCVGRRNYRMFFIFVSSATLYLLFTIGTSALQLYLNTKRFLDLGVPDTGEAFLEAMQFWGSAILLVLVLYCLPTLAFTGALTGFHTYLMIRNLTTNEFIKNTYGPKNRDNPFPTEGCAGIRQRLFSEKTHSKIKMEYHGHLKSNFDVDAFIEEAWEVRQKQEEAERQAKAENMQDIVIDHSSTVENGYSMDPLRTMPDATETANGTI